MSLYLIACALWILVTAFIPNFARKTGPTSLENDPRVRLVLKTLRDAVPQTTEDQIRITEVPAPPFHEAARAAYLKQLLSNTGLNVHVDATGNVIGEYPGTSKDIVMVVAHLDTVFPAGTDVRVRRQGGELLAPGISDNGTGLASLVAVARAFQQARIKTQRTVLFVADVGEEGEGNLRGMRALVETYRGRLKDVIALDGSSTEYVTTAGLSSRRFEVTIHGPGGHSWSDFGTPNPIHAMARGIARFVDTPVPANPRTSFNVGEIEGGTSVNSIPARAEIKVDLRSESEKELSKLEGEMREAMQAGVEQEMAAARVRGMAGGQNVLEMKITTIGVRPAGELSDDSPLLAALDAADSQLGNQSRRERSSTDANIPLSLGIPAIAIGGGGYSGGAHTLEEWYDPSGRELGLQRIALTVLGVAGTTR